MDEFRDTMRALRAHHRGGAEVLVYERAPRPVRASGEVLVAVHAAGITFAELGWDLTWQTEDGSDRTPIIPSHEVSGAVVQIGEGVTDLQVGEEVYGLVPFDRNGAAADLVATPASSLAPAPHGVGRVEAAALPLSALTAWQALVDHARLERGERLLVHGGAGGVGSCAVQLGVGLGADVVATARAEDAELVLSLGAERVIDFEAAAFETVVSGADVVLDTVGGSVLDRSFGVLRLGGRLVTLAAPPPPGLALDYGVEATFFIVQANRPQLEMLAEQVDDGRLRPIVSATFPLDAGRQAYAAGSAPRAPGKIVLVVD